jgi:hypothetical protein
MGLLMLDIKNMLIAAAAGLVIGAGVAGVVAHRYTEARWVAAVEAQKVEAARILQAETEKVLQAERLNGELNNRIEVTHAQAQDEIDRTLADNRRLARQLGGLRDPGRRQGYGGATAGNHPAANAAAAAAESRLSDEAQEFLLGLAADADRAANYALTCQAWAQEVANLNKENPKGDPK